MATIHREVPIDLPAERVWQALSDVAHVDRLFSYLASVELDGNVRSCSIAGGGGLRELIISIDDERRRLAYSVVESPFEFEHHSASWQVEPEGETSRFVWITDVLPDTATTALEPMIDMSIDELRRALDSRAVSS